MGKMNILDPITPPPPQSDDFFYLIVDPYKSRFFFFSSLPGIRNYCSSNLLFILNLRKKGHFYKVFYIFKKNIYTASKIKSL